jgi:hypothetical protein
VNRPRARGSRVSEENEDAKSEESTEYKALFSLQYSITFIHSNTFFTSVTPCL